MTTNVSTVTYNLGISCIYGACSNQFYVDRDALLAADQTEYVEEIYFLGGGSYSSQTQEIALPIVQTMCIGTSLHELIDGMMVLADGTEIAINPLYSEALLAFGVTLYEDEARMEVYSQDVDLVGAVLSLSISSTLNE